VVQADITCVCLTAPVNLINWEQDRGTTASFILSQSTGTGLPIEDVGMRLNIDIQVTEGTPPAPTAMKSFGDMASPLFLHQI
jgi:hypothetical protein